MVAILVTPEIRAVLKSANAEKRITNASAVETISHSSLRSAVKQSKETSPSSKTFVQLLQGCELHLTHEEAVLVHNPPKRSEELDRRITALRCRLENQTYDRIVRDVSRTEANNVQLENIRMSKFAPQMSLGFNIVITMATCFTAAFFVFKASTGSQTVGLIAGVIAMMAAMLVEAILLLTKLYTIEDAVQRDDKRRRS